MFTLLFIYFNFIYFLIVFYWYGQRLQSKNLTIKLKAHYLSDLYVTICKSKCSNLKESQWTNIFQGFKFSYNNQLSHFVNSHKNENLNLLALCK